MNAPFPYFGGKSRVASIVWRALGQPKHYLEPFFGSGAVLLNRPDYDPRKHIETVCDINGHLCNVWRSLQFDHDEVAKWCLWHVDHIDLIARTERLHGMESQLTQRMKADDKYFDAELAGYWIYCACAGLGTWYDTYAHNRRPHISTGGKGINRLSLNDDDLRCWFAQLSDRLRKVRVICGDWTRICGGYWQSQEGLCGLFFDPPYSDDARRDERLYGDNDDPMIAHEVREWCLERGQRDDYRIVLAGYYEEHDSLLAKGWSAHRWSAIGGYGNQGDDNRNRHREALFFSPHCLTELCLFDA